MPVVVHMIEINPAAWVEHVSHGVLWLYRQHFYNGVRLGWLQWSLLFHHAHAYTFSSTSGFLLMCQVSSHKCKSWAQIEQLSLHYAQNVFWEDTAVLATYIYFYSKSFVLAYFWLLFHL